MQQPMMGGSPWNYAPQGAAGLLALGGGLAQGAQAAGTGVMGGLSAFGSVAAPLLAAVQLFQAGQQFYNQREADRIADEEFDYARSGTEYAMRRLLGLDPMAIGPNGTRTPESQRHLARYGDLYQRVQPGSSESRYLPVGAAIAPATEGYGDRRRVERGDESIPLGAAPAGTAGIDPRVVELRKAIHGLLERPAFTGDQIDRMVGMTNLQAGQQLQLAPVQTGAQLNQQLGSLGTVGLGGATQRIQAGLANNQFGRDAAQLGSDVLNRLYRMAGQALPG